MATEQFDTVRSLINEKRFDEAKEILRLINSPTARQWLRKIKELESPDPAQPSRYPSNEQDASLKTLSQQFRLVLIALVVLVVVNLLILTAVLLPVFLSNSSSTNNYEDMDVDCREISNYENEGWRVVTAYSYQTGSASFGYTVYTNCILERPLP
jgi:hypothetical protein